MDSIRRLLTKCNSRCVLLWPCKHENVSRFSTGQSLAPKENRDADNGVPKAISDCCRCSSEIRYVPKLLGSAHCEVDWYTVFRTGGPSVAEGEARHADAGVTGGDMSQACAVVDASPMFAAPHSGIRST